MSNRIGLNLYYSFGEIKNEYKSSRTITSKFIKQQTKVTASLFKKI